MKYIKKRLSLRLAASCLLLFALVGSALAQGNDGQYVIKVGGQDHYLAHVKVDGQWVLQDATTFSTACLWYSGREFNIQGTNHNYYFVDEDTNEFVFLRAPKAPNGQLSLSTGVPQTYQLNNTDAVYYFYDWDKDTDLNGDGVLDDGGGVARGAQYNVSVNDCQYSWHQGQCWEVYWAEYRTNVGWILTEESHYSRDPDEDDEHGGVPNAGLFRLVTITEHDAAIANLVPAGGGISNINITIGESSVTEINYQEMASLSAALVSFTCDYTPAYVNYAFTEVSTPYFINYYYNNEGVLVQGNPPTTTVTNDPSDASYHWAISGPGVDYLRLNGEDTSTPTLEYYNENTQGNVSATITLTVTYSTGVTVSATSVIMVMTSCQNPAQASSPVVTYGSVSISWYPTATQYHLYWQKEGGSWQGPAVVNTTSYTFTDLDYNSNYIYKMVALCNGMEQPDAYEYSFTTKEEPKALILGSVFGGGRMADVNGKTEVAIINTDSIGAVYGGNDIAGKVLGAAGATITLGINENDGTYGDFNNNAASTKVRIGDVYGGGNGYYIYDGNQPSPAVGTTVLTNGQFSSSVTEVGGGDSYASSGTIPALTKSVIMVSNNAVKVDSIFGGAKNAFVTNTSDNSTSITVDGGTVFAVFGGNNYGGTLGEGSTQYIKVNKTTINLVPSIENTETTGYGRDFGICYLFGGGNKVEGQRSEIIINGGQCDTVFAGGNSASVTAANLTVDCAIDDNNGTDYTYGNVYSNAIDTYSGGVITPLDEYDWNGYDGIYNVRTLFGGNNRAAMNIVPNVTLTSGSVGTAYGGGNAGDMTAEVNGTSYLAGDFGSNYIGSDAQPIFYSTHIVLESDKMIVDYLYGGCEMSNVYRSTWTEVRGGNVGTVYGGCNISGDVGSHPEISWYNGISGEEYQLAKGATYVKAYGGTVYKNIVAGSNGYYHCNNGLEYVAGINYGYPLRNYVGLPIPTHNETHVLVADGATIKGDVYAGGNMASVGFIPETDFNRTYRDFVGFASVRMTGGLVEGNVYGGGNMASVYGSNEVRVSGGTIQKALYGGNDKFGIVAQITNRVLPSDFNKASDDKTDLIELGVKTYVGVHGNAHITTVYGGGNGDYDYTVGEWCDANDQPVQSNTFVDINLLGNTNEATGGHVRTVYGGGNGVTVTGGITVFLNVGNDPDYSHACNDYTQVDTIFGGNNKGDLELAADIIMLRGQVGTVYGGCNRGAMAATESQYLQTIGDFENIGSYVRLLASYDGDGDGENLVTPNINVTHAIYGGCRMNGVTNNSLVLVEGGNFLNTLIFGGSDISGHVGGWSRVATTGGTVGNMYGGGNGNYSYDFSGYGAVYDISGSTLVTVGDEHHPITNAPTCQNSGADILGGNVGTTSKEGAIFGGGLGELTNTIDDVIVNVGRPTATGWTDVAYIYGNVYGGSALGSVNTNGDNSTTVNFLNGKLVGNLYGGGLGESGADNVTKGQVNGKVFVNISNSSQEQEDCFIDLRSADIFGCNNTNGSPQDDVTVHVWRTAFDFPDNEYDYSAATGTHPYYAINQVFGGGNKAHYLPENGDTESGKKILVYVHDCLNTIKWVYAGGNAADATGVSTLIEGGRMDYVFGGGNGAGEGNPGANIYLGGTDTEVQGGKINHLFGGSNEKGDITGIINTVVNNDYNCEEVPEQIGEFYGGANLAEMNPDGINTIIECGAGTFTEVYGGSKLADITGNVTLNIRGGVITQAYGGSKGRDGNTDDDAADIDGKVTLNLEGGTITDAFGGSNINGAITDSITVNVIDFGGECGLDLTNVYGAGNLTPYTPSNNAAPVVNVMHIAQEDGIRGNVYGGGKGATAIVTANPVVNFGYNAATMLRYLNSITDQPESLDPDDFTAYVSGINQEGNIQSNWGNVFGGGDLAAVTGNPIINVYSGEVAHKVVGGGNQADITGNTGVYVMGGTIGTDGNATTGAGKGVYGGCNETGTVSGNAIVELTGGTVGVSTTNTANIHGGGYGQNTSVVGNVTVNFGDNTNVENTGLVLYGELYGGSALGKVNTADENNPGASTTTTVNLLNGIINGAAYGGGLGDASHEALVNGVVHVNVGAPTGSGTFIGKANLINCDVYGCNNVSGKPQSEVFVDVYQTAHNDDNVVGNTDGSYAIHQVFGGGNQADYIVNVTQEIVLNTNVFIHGCENTIWRVFGGGNAADVGGVNLTLDGGRMDLVFGGGNGELGPDYAANVGIGGITILLGGGRINNLTNGSNQNGVITGPINLSNYTGCGDIVVIDHFCGSNQDDIFEDITENLNCEIDPTKVVKFVNLYCGSNLAQIYGNINLTIYGGVYENVFGGSKGRLADPEAGVNAYASNIYIVNQNMIDTIPQLNQADLNRGGNINLMIHGGTIGNVFGACDLNGNVEGKINITVEEEGICPLFIGNIYGGGHITDYTPVNTDNGSGSTFSPEIKVLKAHVGGTHQDLPVINDGTGPTVYEGNVFGGGYQGNVTSNPIVIIGKPDPTDSPVTIEGNVYGGGKEGKVIGDTKVIIVPTNN